MPSFFFKLKMIYYFAEAFNAIILVPKIPEIFDFFYFEKKKSTQAVCVQKISEKISRSVGKKHLILVSRK
jgi:hypothetical protein